MLWDYFIKINYIIYISKIKFLKIKILYYIYYKIYKILMKIMGLEKSDIMEHINSSTNAPKYYFFHCLTKNIVAGYEPLAFLRKR